MVGAQRGLGAGHAVLGGQQGALRVQHGAEVDQAALVALAGQQLGVGGGVGRGLLAGEFFAVPAQRGQGVFEKSILALQALNALGYSQPGSDRVLNLVYNPQKAVLPPPQADRTQQAAAITPWGGFVSSPFVTSFLPGELGSRWVVNPFDFLSQALRLPEMPIPDTTTESGKRMLMIHMDGDGFISRSETPGNPIAGEMVRDRVVRKYALPMTISVIEAEIAPDGLYPGLSPLAEKVAKEIFAAPHVAIASHSYSHPFFWYKASAGEGSDSYNLRIPGYRFDVKREVDGSIAYIERRLAPRGKKVEVFLWTGDCIPTSEALRAVAQWQYTATGKVHKGQTVQLDFELDTPSEMERVSVTPQHN